MITLDALIAAVQQAVSSATDEVAKSNLNMINRYFDEITDVDELSGIIKSAINSAETAINEGEDDAAQQSLRDAAQALAAAASRVNADSRGEETEPFFVPKRVSIQYPEVGPKGKPQVRNVQVPLITLVPMGVPEVQEVRFRANLEMSTQSDGTLNVSFASPNGLSEAKSKIHPDRTQRPTDDTNPTVQAATVDILVSSPRAPDGLKKIVEGFEKALRAQIPG